MTLRNFIKENFVLVTGLALPVLLVAGFLLASTLPQAAAVPPQYEMLFTSTRYDQQNHTPYNVDFYVKDGKLTARLWKNTSTAGSYARKVFAYNAKENSVREIPYDVTSLGDMKDQSQIVLKEFQEMNVDNATKSPDGYSFEGYAYGGGWPVTEIFGGHNDRSPRLTKGSAVFRMPNSNGTPYYSYDVQFLGWLIKK